MKLKLPEPGLVPMDAHGQNWSVTELEGGRLCLPERSARNNEVTELLVSGQVGAQIGSGLAGGEVYLTPAGQAENIAIKRFTATTRQGETGLQHGGLSELQAHHLLAVGLDMVKQADDTPWHFRGIRVHGGLLYPNGDGPDRATAVWAMERVLPASAETDTACSWENYLSSKRGRLARMAATYLDLSLGEPDLGPAPLPPKQAREQLYWRAIDAAGGYPSLVVYTDQYSNLLVERPPTFDSQAGTVVKPGIIKKIDVQSCLLFPLTGARDYEEIAH